MRSTRASARRRNGTRRSSGRNDEERRAGLGGVEARPGVPGSVRGRKASAVAAVGEVATAVVLDRRDDAVADTPVELRAVLLGHVPVDPGQGAGGGAAAALRLGDRAEGEDAAGFVGVKSDR